MINATIKIVLDKTLFLLNESLSVLILSEMHILAWARRSEMHLGMAQHLSSNWENVILAFSILRINGLFHFAKHHVIYLTCSLDPPISLTSAM